MCVCEGGGGMLDPFTFSIDKYKFCLKCFVWLSAPAQNAMGSILVCSRPNGKFNNTSIWIDEINCYVFQVPQHFKWFEKTER